MSNRDWDKELAMIDRQLASLSDEELAAQAAPEAPSRGGQPVAPPAARPAPAGAVAPARPAGAVAGGAAAAPGAGTGAGTGASTGWRARVAVNGKLLLALAAGVGIAFWPYGYRCGSELAVYLAAVAGVVLSGVWAARSTWRHRAGKRHALALLVVLWGIGLAAWQVLPRTGHAIPTMDRPAIWSCG